MVCVSAGAAVFAVLVVIGAVPQLFPNRQAYTVDLLHDIGGEDPLAGGQVFAELLGIAAAHKHRVDKRLAHHPAQGQLVNGDPGIGGYAAQCAEYLVDFGLCSFFAMAGCSAASGLGEMPRVCLRGRKLVKRSVFAGKQPLLKVRNGLNGCTQKNRD